MSKYFSAFLALEMIQRAFGPRGAIWELYEHLGAHGLVSRHEAKNGKPIAHNIFVGTDSGLHDFEKKFGMILSLFLIDTAKYFRSVLFHESNITVKVLCTIRFFTKFIPKKIG